MFVGGLFVEDVGVMVGESDVYDVGLLGLVVSE